MLEDSMGANETMIAASHIVPKRAGCLLAAVVAILFLFVPMAEANPVECGMHTGGSQAAVSSQVEPDLHADSDHTP
ncbi:hypothetical protein [Ensifer adhaerens]|uniref:hypothetical protein n=1 Tax=Ensifer adhaerens TaxID=106592 RepID=UPI003F83A560